MQQAVRLFDEDTEYILVDLACHMIGGAEGGPHAAGAGLGQDQQAFAQRGEQARSTAVGNQQTVDHQAQTRQPLGDRLQARLDETLRIRKLCDLPRSLGKDLRGAVFTQRIELRSGFRDGACHPGWHLHGAALAVPRLELSLGILQGAREALQFLRRLQGVDGVDPAHWQGCQPFLRVCGLKELAQTFVRLSDVCATQQGLAKEFVVRTVVAMRIDPQLAIDACAETAHFVFIADGGRLGFQHRSKHLPARRSKAAGDQLGELAQRSGHARERSRRTRIAQKQQQATLEVGAQLARQRSLAGVLARARGQRGQIREEQLDLGVGALTQGTQRGERGQHVQVSHSMTGQPPIEVILQGGNGRAQDGAFELIGQGGGRLAQRRFELFSQSLRARQFHHAQCATDLMQVRERADPRAGIGPVGQV